MVHSDKLLPADILRREVEIDLSLPRSNGAFNQAVASTYFPELGLIYPTMELLKQLPDMKKDACTSVRVEIDIMLCPKSPDGVGLNLQKFSLANRRNARAFITVYDVLQAISDWCRAPVNHFERLPDDVQKDAWESARKRKARFPTDNENLRQCDLLHGCMYFVGIIEIMDQQRPGGSGVDLWMILLESNTDQANV